MIVHVRPSRRPEDRNCQHCSQVFQTRKDLKTKYCGLSCAGKAAAAARVEEPPNVFPPEMTYFERMVAICTPK